MTPKKTDDPWEGFDFNELLNPPPEEAKPTQEELATIVENVNADKLLKPSSRVPPNIGLTFMQFLALAYIGGCILIMYMTLRLPLMHKMIAGVFSVFLMILLLHYVYVVAQLKKLVGE